MRISLQPIASAWALDCVLSLLCAVRLAETSDPWMRILDQQRL